MLWSEENADLCHSLQTGSHETHPSQWDAESDSGKFWIKTGSLCWEAPLPHCLSRLPLELWQSKEMMNPKTEASQRAEWEDTRSLGSRGLWSSTSSSDRLFQVLWIEPNLLYHQWSSTVVFSRQCISEWETSGAFVFHFAHPQSRYLTSTNSRALLSRPVGGDMGPKSNIWLWVTASFQLLPRAKYLFLWETLKEGAELSLRKALASRKFCFIKTVSTFTCVYLPARNPCFTNLRWLLLTLRESLCSVFVLIKSLACISNPMPASTRACQWTQTYSPWIHKLCPQTVGPTIYVFILGCYCFLSTQKNHNPD